MNDPAHSQAEIFKDPFGLGNTPCRDSDMMEGEKTLFHGASKDSRERMPLPYRLR